MKESELPHSITVRNAQRKLVVEVGALQRFATAALREAVRTTPGVISGLPGSARVSRAGDRVPRSRTLKDCFGGTPKPAGETPALPGRKSSALPQTKEAGVAAVAAASPEHLDVVLVSDKRMAALHKRFMGIAGPTDVITFQHGEIVVSVETAATQARDHDSSLDAELRLYIVHGILHLLGLDDTRPAAAALMERRQTEIVSALRRPV